MAGNTSLGKKNEKNTLVDLDVDVQVRRGESCGKALKGKLQLVGKCAHLIPKHITSVSHFSFLSLCPPFRRKEHYLLFVK